MSDKKRTASKDHVCPCKNCKSECTQSIKIVTRPLEVFGRSSGDHDNQLSESGSEDELLAKSNDYRHDDNDHDDQLSESGSGDELLAETNDYRHDGNDSFAGLSYSSEENCGRNFKRRRIDSTSISEQSDGEIIQNEIDITSSSSDNEVSIEHDLAALSDDSGSNESLPSYSSSDHKDCDLEMEHDIYDSENAKIPLFENSDITVLQALASYFMWFTEHPSTSKSALSDLLRLKKRLLPQPNNLPGSYDAAYNFVKPFLLPTVSYHVCPNDCVIFRKTSRYDYSKLQKCPVCGSNRYWGNKINARRRFLYFPLGPRWRRMFGNASISEVIQSHADNRDACEDSSIMRDIHDSPSWKQAFSEEGFCNGDLRGMLLQLSTDGVNPFSSNKVNYSMWPIMLTALNLPRNVRNLFENIMLAGIVPAQTEGQEPKHLDPYLEIVVDEVLELSGATFFDAFRNASFTFKVALMSYVLDYPGLGKVFTAAGQTALQGCMWCEIRGKAIQTEQYNTKK